jgi:hypothetical protein
MLPTREGKHLHADVWIVLGREQAGRLSAHDIGRAYSAPDDRFIEDNP